MFALTNVIRKHRLHILHIYASAKFICALVSAFQEVLWSLHCRLLKNEAVCHISIDFIEFLDRSRQGIKCCLTYF